MSLTEAETLFAGVHESGLNDLLTAYFRARPRMLNYRTSDQVADSPTDPDDWTPLQPIAFPGAPPIHYAAQLAIPHVDIHPGSIALPPPLVLGDQLFALQTSAVLYLLCRSRKGREERLGTVLRTGLEVAAIGRFLRRGTPGSARVSVEILQVEIADISPESLESMLECLLLTILSAALAPFEIPLAQLPVPALGVTLTVGRGPEAEDDQFKLYGTVA